MEYEVRFYYKKKELHLIINKLDNIEILKTNNKKYKKTIQYNHPSKEYNNANEIIAKYLKLLDLDINKKYKLSWDDKWRIM